MKPARIFISYARGDDPKFVQTLHDDLRSRARASGDRLRLFFDKQDMPSRGKSFLLEIRDFIGDPETERVLLVVGPGALESPYVQAELRAALQRCVIVVPLLRLGCARHQYPRNPRRVDDEDFGLIPADVRETGVHAIDFRERSGALPGRRYEDAFEDLWRVLGEPAELGKLGRDVPDLPGNFILRAEYVTALGRHVLPDADDPVTVQGERRFVVLSGMGGVGKSVMAAAFCRECKTRRSFKDGIAWVRMGARPALPAELVDAFGLSRTSARGNRVRTALRDMSCLIVLDDVTDPTHVARFKNEIGESGRLLVTTRNAAVATALNAYRCDVDLLTESESLELLADWSGYPIEDLPPAALDALSECGRLPLAISMIGAMMKGKPKDRWRYVVSDLKSANLDEIRHRFPDYEHPDLLRALKVSVDNLEGHDDDQGEWERKVQARRRYLELAIFPGNTPLPHTVLAKYWASAGVGEAVTVKLTDLFVERNLARRAEIGRIVLHDLQRDFLVSEQRTVLTTLNQRFLDAHRPKGGWHNAVDDGYLLEHLASHLRNAGLASELTGLVNRDWMEKRFASGGSHRGFADDVETAIDAAGEDTSSEGLVALAKAGLAHGAIAQLATEAPPAFIGTLARTGQVDKAIHNASLMSDTRRRVFALSEVVVVLIEQGNGLGTARRLVEQLLGEVEGSEDRELRILVVCWAARCLAELQLPGPAAAAVERVLALLEAESDTHVRVRVLENVSCAFLHMNRRADARRVARKAFKAAQGPTSSRAELLRDAALVLIEVGDEKGLSEAVALLRGRTVSDARQADALLLVADSLFAAGRRAEAAVLVEQVRGAILGFRDLRQRAILLSSTAVTLGRVGEVHHAEALAKRALAAMAKPRGRSESFGILTNVAMLAITSNQKARAAQLARRALKTVSRDSSDRLEAAANVAQLLSDAGRQDEAKALLDETLAAAWTIRNPWNERDTAAILGEALIRVGEIEQGASQIIGLSDAYGARGRAQQRIAGVLAEVGAWDAAESLARSTDELYRPETLRRVAVALARKGLHNRAHSVAKAIEYDSTRVRALCETAVLNDEAAVQEARDTAKMAESSEALGILSERLAAQGNAPAARQIARLALDIAEGFKHHAFVAALGDLARPFLAAGDASSVRRVDALLRQVGDDEYRADGRLRLALALAEAKQPVKARVIVKHELPTVERLQGRDIPKASMLATIALTLFHAGSEEDAVRRARQALVQLDRSGGSSNSDYDKDLARERAVAVLTRTKTLAEAFAQGEIGFAELAANGGRDEDSIDALLIKARLQLEGPLHAEALAWVARALGKLGARQQAKPMIFEALRSARRGGRTSVIEVIEIAAGVIASLDSGVTLIRVCDVIKEVESWWAQRPARSR